MTTVPVPKMRSAIVDDPTGLSFVIPARRIAFVMVFLPVWLVGWVFGAVMAARELAGGAQGKLFLALWLAAWMVGGGFAALTWLWMLAGRERVTLTQDALVQRYELFGVGRRREYALQNVRNLRVSPDTDASSARSGFKAVGIGSGVVAFDYGARTIRIGGSIDEAEGRMIVERLKQRHAFQEGVH